MADKISGKSALEVWRLGVPLRDAAEVFGVVRNKTKVKCEARQAASETAALLKSAFLKTGAEWDPVYDGIEPSLASLNEWSRSSTAKVDRLFELLRLGDLVALGYPIHRPDPYDPVQIPPFMLERQFAKWGQGAFIGLGRHYARAVVCEPPPEPTEIDAQPSPKRTGAPSYDGDLEAIARELDRRGIPLNPRPWKPLYFQVRSLGIEMELPRFDDHHPDDETIRRFFFKRAATENGLETQ